MRKWKYLCVCGLVAIVAAMINCDQLGSSTNTNTDDGTTEEGVAIANGVYPVAGFGMNGAFVLDTVNNVFVCIAQAGGDTVGDPSTFLMVMTGKRLDRARFDQVKINGEFKNRVQLTGDAHTFTINNGVEGAPGFQEGEIETLFDENEPCTFVVEAIDDDEGGDRWETMIFDSTLWPNGTKFTNVEGDSILTGYLQPLLEGDIVVKINGE